jgi:hypothetical protein
MEMGLRRARELVVLMVREFQPYGATWAELMHKSGLKPTAYKRAFNYATGQKWFVGGGGQGKPYYLNRDGCWRAALGPVFLSSPVGPDVQSETRSGGLSSDAVQTLNADSIVALASEAIRHANKG